MNPAGKKAPRRADAPRDAADEPSSNGAGKEASPKSERGATAEGTYFFFLNIYTYTSIYFFKLMRSHLSR